METTKEAETASKAKRAPRQKLNINALENSPFLSYMLAIEATDDFIRDALRRTDGLPPVKVMCSIATSEADNIMRTFREKNEDSNSFTTRWHCHVQPLP